MILFVVEIRHDGLALTGPGSSAAMYLLPATNLDETAGSWQDFRDAAEPDMALNVTLVPGRHAPGGLEVVTLRGPGARELSLEWKGEIHALKVESMSKALIRGRIGSVNAVMEREEYMHFLNRFSRNDRVQDHGALALGDVVCGVFRAEQGPEGRVHVSFRDALDLIENECEGRVREQPGHGDGAAKEDADKTQQAHGPLFHTPREDLSPFLYVEDDDLCRQMWRDFLATNGVVVDAYGTYEEALKAIQETGRPYKIAVVDVHLRPGATDHLGLSLAQSLVASQPNCRIVLCSAEDNPDHMIEDWREFPVHGYIVKPALLEDWVTTIDAAVAMKECTPLRELLPDSETQGTDGDVVPPANHKIVVPTVERVLNTFCREAPGTTVHVFRLHPRPGVADPWQKPAGD